MKKIISLLLVTVMLFSTFTVAFSVQSFAADTGSTTAESKDDITKMLLELAKIANGLNDSAREKFSEELKELLVEKLTGGSTVAKPVAEWIVNQALKLSGADNLLTLNKSQAEKIADFLSKLYAGKIADYVQNPVLQVVLKLVPEDFYKEAIVWILSDGLGTALKDFIKNNGGTVDDKKESKSDEIFSAIIKAVKDIVNEVKTKIIEFFSMFTKAVPLN